jgi:hypothetical protein
LEEAYIPTHHPEVRDLPAFHPKIDSLRADTEKLRGLADCPGILIMRTEVGVGAVHNQRTVRRRIVYASRRMVCTIGIRSS